jgi:hypothetical protein
MKIRITKCWLGAAVGLITAAIQPAIADEWNKETRIIVNAPVQIPGKVLTPGTYVFRLLDSPSNRNIVEIYSEDASGNQTFVTTTLVIPAYRLDTPDKPVINLEERHTGTPEAIHTWFYPGDNSGWEFVYPKSERLQEAVNQPTPAPAAAPVEAPPPPGPEEAAAPEPAPEVIVEETEVVIAQNEPPDPSLEPLQEPASSADRELPETAEYSVSQLLAAMGLLGLGLMGVRVGCRQSA